MKEKTKPARRPEATTIRWTEEDWRIIEDLREDLRKQQGGRNTSEIVRMGLRALQRETKKK